MQNKDKSRTEIKSVELLLYCKNNPNVISKYCRLRSENARTCREPPGTFVPARDNLAKHH